MKSVRIERSQLTRAHRWKSLASFLEILPRGARSAELASYQTISQVPRYLSISPGNLHI